MTHQEGLAEELDALKDSGHELDGFTPIRARVAKAPRSVVSLRMSPQELHEIIAAADVLDRNVSEFIREAALKEARLAQAGIDAARKAALAKQS